MPKFKQRASKALSPGVKGRSFFKVKKAAPIKQPKAKAAPAVQALPDEIETLSSRYADDPESISKMIDESADRLSRLTMPAEDNAIPSFTADPDGFDGVKTTAEQYKILSQEANQEHRQARQLEDRLSMLQKEYEQEKSKLAATIRELKQELHRTKPLHDNAVFTLTRELRDSVQQMEALMQTSRAAPAPAPPFTGLPAGSPAAPTVSPVPVTLPQPSPAPVQTQARTVTAPPTQNPPPAANKSQKKTGTVVAVAGFALLVLSGAAAYQLIQTPKVDQEIVNEYLTKQTGQVAGAETQAPSVMEAQTSGSSKTEAANESEEKQMHEAVPFEQTIWETLREPTFGIKLQYPGNAAKLLHTPSNVTFLRQDGYIFKIQKIETALAPEKYWEQIKATSLNYKDSKSTFLDREAVYLELQDVTDYPGNRYLVREGNFIYDIWYATEGNKFSADDIKRANYMLDSLTLLPE